MKLTALCLAIVLFFAARVSGAERKWTDDTGRFTVTADLVSVADGKVTLKRSDGSTVTLLVSRLSKTDREFLRSRRVAAENAKKINEVLHWFPTDTETLIVARGPFTIKPTSDDEPPDFQEIMESLPMSLIHTIENGALRKLLIGKRVSFAVEGSRHFRGPRGLGMMPFEGCQVVLFEDEAVSSLAMRWLLKEAPSSVKLAKHEVAVFTEEWEKDTWTLYFTEPKPGLLLCATNPGYLEVTLKRIGKTSSPRALPENLPEWKHVNTRSPFWAIRHFDKTQARNDPSSPLRGEAAANTPDMKAVGMVFGYDPADGKIAAIRYLSGAKDAVKIAKQGWDSLLESKGLKVKMLRPGVVEISCAVDKNDVGALFAFELMARLGHAVYV